jgi:hypothetical protein
MARRAAIDAALKAQALQRAAEIGPAAAARELGLKAGTIRGWLARASKPIDTPSTTQTPTATPAQPGEIYHLERLARDARAVAAIALRESRAAMADGRSMDAQRYATVHGIAVDKTSVLERQLTVAVANRAQLAQQTAEQLAAVLDQALEALGIDDMPGRQLVAGLLRQASAGEPIVADRALADQARRGHRERIAGELGEQLAELRRQRDADAEFMSNERGLPAPAPHVPHPDGDEEDDPEHEPMAAPIQVLRGKVVHDDEWTPAAWSGLRVVEARTRRGRRESRNRL